VTTTLTRAGIAVDREGPRGGTPLVLVHAGVADRRMWDPLWSALPRHHDTIRLDLRGYGDSTGRPRGALHPVGDVVDTLAELGIERCHVVGASLGAGVAVETSVSRPALVASLLLAAPGGSLVAELTPDLAAFVEAERAALSRGDLDGAVEANLRWWVDGPRRGPEGVDPQVRALVAGMQRRAFELTAGWDDVEEDELEPPVLERLGEVRAPTLVLVGELDLDAIQDSAGRLVAGVPGAVRVDWPDAGHLPSLEHPARFLALVRHRVDEVEARPR